VFSDGEANLLLDLYERLDGPRIRDSVSHFDCDAPNAISERLSNVVFISAAVILKTSVQLKHHAPLSEHQAFVDQYQPRYHPKYMAQWAACRTMDYVEDSVDIARSMGREVCVEGKLMEWIGADGQEATCDVFTCDSDLQVLRHLLRDQTSVTSLLRPRRLDCLFTPKRELELASAFLNVLRCEQKAMCNMIGSLEEKHELLRDRKLRSRQRKTFQQMLDSLATLLAGSALMATLAAMCLLRSCDTEEKYESRLRFVHSQRIISCLSDGKVWSLHVMMI
jgi:hypothetical protein